MSESEIKILQRIDSKLTKLTKLLNQPKEEIVLGKWVSGFVLTKITGWNYKMKRKAREQNLIVYKKENGSYLYLLSSIPNEFKKTA